MTNAVQNRDSKCNMPFVAFSSYKLPVGNVTMRLSILFVILLTGLACSKEAGHSTPPEAKHPLILVAADGLGAAGGPGVHRAIEILRSDIIRTLKLLGCSSVAALDRSYVGVPPEWEPTRDARSLVPESS